jgi:hypothetical protein
MQTKFKIRVLFSILAVLTCIVACRKDLGTNDVQTHAIATTDRTDILPTVDHGMLKFTSYRAADDYTKSLQLQEQNPEVVRNAYIQLGVSINDSTSINLTDHPVCLLRDQSLGFLSKRKAEETVINNALNGGQDVYSLVTNPYWKTILNQDGSVILGNRIYCFFDNEGVVIVLNSDWATYANSVQSKTFEQIREGYNVMVTSSSSDSWKNGFDLDENANVVSEKILKIPRFKLVPSDAGKFSVENVSLIEAQSATSVYTWKYADGSSSQGLVPNRDINAGEALTVQINTSTTEPSTDVVLSPAIPCPENVTVTRLQGNKFRFELPGYSQGSIAYVKMRWVFSDGFVSGWDINPIERSFTSNGTVTCEFRNIQTNTLYCSVSKPIIVTCGMKRTAIGTLIFDQSGERWKLDASIWVQQGEVGSRVKYLKWYGAILGWKPGYNRGSCASLTGTYVREITVPINNCIDVSASGSKCLGEGTFPTSVAHTIAEVPAVFTKPGLLSARLGINVFGTWRGFGYAGTAPIVLP